MVRPILMILMILIILMILMRHACPMRGELTGVAGGELAALGSRSQVLRVDHHILCQGVCPQQL